MQKRFVSPWKKMPFVKLLIPLMAGISVQWYLQFPLLIWLAVFLSASILFGLFFFLPIFSRYRLSFLDGFAVTFIFLAIGAILTMNNDIKNDPHWWAARSKEKTSYFIVTLDENPVEKTRSFKANASINFLIDSGQKKKTVTGKIILYFDKDSFPATLSSGSEIVFAKALQEIKNSGNPGGFDYKRYCLFQQITHQVYLNSGDYILSDKKNESALSILINNVRKKVLNILATYIPGEKEKGLAEALLIGYKDDLDKTLVQSYTNTGVVHIIAISGLHLGLIYWLLVQLLKPLQRRKVTKWLKPVLVIAGLWLFSLLAGAQPSVLRSAVMFTCIVLGESIGRKSSIYNSLAASAFILLCYNPYWLWDVGFQLSYAAVLSIVIFMQPVYNWFYIKNKALDFVWKMNAVTIAAQILTVPISIFHFHQFPNYFLLTNLIAVPVSSLIVLGEILLCAVSFIPFLASATGKVLSGMIWFMNTWVERIEALPFSLWDGLQINFVQMVLLTMAICLFCYWLLEKQKAGFISGLIVLLTFISLRSFYFIQTKNQKKIIVYNIPKQSAMDIIDGKSYRFIGDSLVERDDFVRNFHLKPSRIINRTYGNSTAGTNEDQESYFTVEGKHVLIIDTAFSLDASYSKPVVDLLVLSKSPRLYISKLAENLIIRQIVFDGSVPAWKRNYWKKDCDSLHIPNYDVNENGAFVMNLR